MPYTFTKNSSTPDLFVLLNSRESPPGKPLQRLERCDGKLSRTVLRGLEDSNIPRLPDYQTFKRPILEKQP